MEYSISLPKGRWKFDNEKLLGVPGGFGEVFQGFDDTGKSVAIKRLKISVPEAAYREIRMADYLQTIESKYILPFIDAGQDAETDSYFIVMPVADYSLADYLNQTGLLEEREVLSILHNISEGLREANDIVHRDLKPQNILWHDNLWKLADFGIAKFVEESTSLHTLKDCLSPQYAAPEQWMYEKSTRATDIYALGCIGHTLLTGVPPFHGPQNDDYKRQHIQDAPAMDLKCSHMLRSALAMMLRKNPEARPSLRRVIKLFSRDADSLSIENKPGHAKLAQAGAMVAAKQAELEAIAAKENERTINRMNLSAEAEKIFKRMRKDLFHDIADIAPMAVCEDGARIRLDNAVIEMKLVSKYVENVFVHSGWDVIISGQISVRQPSPVVYIWGSSLWYSKLSSNDEYRWREVSYFTSAYTAERPAYEPYAITDERRADVAASNMMGLDNIAFGPVCIDDENIEEFKNRWIYLYSSAVNGNLGHPSGLPLQPDYFNQR